MILSKFPGVRSEKPDEVSVGRCTAEPMFLGVKIAEECKPQEHIPCRWKISPFMGDVRAQSGWGWFRKHRQKTPPVQVDAITTHITTITDTILPIWCKQPFHIRWFLIDKIFLVTLEEFLTHWATRLWLTVCTEMIYNGIWHLWAGRTWGASNCLCFWRGYPASEVFSGMFQSTAGKYSYLHFEEV